MRDGQWAGYRDVAEVDGRLVRDRQERVEGLFLSRAADRHDQLLRVANESARYNLGSFKRNLNVPTIPLFLLHPRNHARFEFRLGKPETVAGTNTAVVEYRERMRPTLTATSRGRDVFIKGRLWLEPFSGRVVQTEVRFELPEMSSSRTSIVTRYRLEQGTPVPDYMWEWYGSGVSGWVYEPVASHVEVVTECLARYSNYRRFQVDTSEQVKP